MDETKKDDGGPAFPSHGSMGEVVQEGMSLRDYFAGQALGWMARDPNQIGGAERLARDAYHLADAMLSERSK